VKNLKVEIEILSGLEASEEFERFEDDLREFLSEYGLEAKIIDHATGNELTVKPVPACPECGCPLKSIAVEKLGNSLHFNAETGLYYYDEVQVKQVYKCPECGKPIGGWRADGERWGFVPETE